MMTTILPTYHPPKAFSATYTIGDSQSIPITLVGSVADQGVTIQFVIQSPFSILGTLKYNNQLVQENTIIPSGASMTYTPLLGQDANDTFYFVAVASSGLNSTVASVGINVTHERGKKNKKKKYGTNRL